MSWATSEFPQAIAVQPDTFPQFRKLLPELRLKVWRFAAYLPNNIKFYFDAYKMKDIWFSGLNDVQVKPPYNVQVKPRYRVPSVLHTNSESRHEALNIYQLSFGNQFRNPIYYNYAVDILIFALNEERYFWKGMAGFNFPAPNLLLTTDWPDVTNLVVTRRMLVESDLRYLKELFKKLRTLKTLIVNHDPASLLYVDGYTCPPMGGMRLNQPQISDVIADSLKQNTEDGGELPVVTYLPRRSEMVAAGYLEPGNIFDELEYILT